MKIGELARRTAVSERSLRYYEEQGLLASERTPSGHRTYPERAVDRVIRIQELFAAGLCSGKVYELLPCMRDEDGGPSEAATPWLVADLTRQRARIDRQIAELIRTREVLDDVITAASEPSPAAGRAPARGGPGQVSGSGPGASVSAVAVVSGPAATG